MENIQIPTEKIKYLKKIEFGGGGISNIVAGAAYYESMKGVSSNKYWKTDIFDIRDEFFVILNAYFSIVNDLQKSIPHNNDWKIEFDVAYYFQIKSTAQSAKAIDELVFNHCYADAYVICRTLISRLNLLLLCSLNPELFNKWLRNPKDERFLDGHIRKELENNGISTGSHLYRFTSEIIHSQFEALSNVGFFEKGLFPEITAARQSVYVIAKFVIATAYMTMIKMTELDYDGLNYPKALKNHRAVFDWLRTSYLAHNRWDQLFTFIAEDRHCEKIGKAKYKIGGGFNFDTIEEQLSKFHRTKGQKKKLSKKYYKN